MPIDAEIRESKRLVNQRMLRTIADGEGRDGAGRVYAADAEVMDPEDTLRSLSCWDI